MTWTVDSLKTALGPWLVTVNGEIAQGAQFGKIITDSRKIEKGCVFLAIRGARFDGHDFATKAVEEGAACLILDHSVGAKVPELIVRNTVEAYGTIASAWRQNFRIPLIEVVGANGKTTTTQMIASILRAAVGESNMLSTAGNFNNNVGVPMTLLNLREGVKAAVVEAGISHPGEMAQLSSWIKPTVTVITNAQREHQEFLETVEGSARENALAIVSLSTNGTAILPTDDACLPIWGDYVRARGCKVITYCEGEGAKAKIMAKTASEETLITTPKGNIRLKLAQLGRHAAHDAAAACAATLAIGIPLETVAKGLALFKPVKGRGNRHRLANGTVVIDDAYNANPDSMRAAIDVLASMPTPRIMVIGDMGEVGLKSEEFHREIGVYARERGVEKIYATGVAIKETVKAFGSGARHFETTQELTRAALDVVREPCTVLVKASNFMHLDTVVQAILEKNQ